MCIPSSLADRFETCAIVNWTGSPVVQMAGGHYVKTRRTVHLGVPACTSFGDSCEEYPLLMLCGVLPGCSKIADIGARKSRRITPSHVPLVPSHTAGDPAYKMGYTTPLTRLFVSRVPLVFFSFLCCVIASVLLNANESFALQGERIAYRIPDRTLPAPLPDG